MGPASNRQHCVRRCGSRSFLVSCSASLVKSYLEIPHTFILMVLVGVIGMAIPFSLEISALRRLDATRAGIAAMFELPVCAFILSSGLPEPWTSGRSRLHVCAGCITLVQWRNRESRKGQSSQSNSIYLSHRCRLWNRGLLSTHTLEHHIPFDFFTESLDCTRLLTVKQTGYDVWGRDAGPWPRTLRRSVPQVSGWAFHSRSDQAQPVRPSDELSRRFFSCSV